MTTKIYRTRELKGYILHLIIDGVKVYISFTRGCTIGSTATFVTSDPKIQQALESLKAFNRTFYIAKIEKTEDEVVAVDPAPVAEAAPAVEEEKEVVDILDAQTFNNLVELRNALKDKGIDVSQLTNVKTAESVAKKNGYNYTVEKKV